jgi:hypothetical protein
MGGGRCILTQFVSSEFGNVNFAPNKCPVIRADFDVASEAIGLENQPTHSLDNESQESRAVVSNRPTPLNSAISDILGEHH